MWLTWCWHVTNNRTAAAERLPFWRLLAYAGPALPLAALTLPVFVLIPDAYAQLDGLNLATVGLVLLVARMWDPITDPLAGWLSDRTRTRLGARLPWVLAGLLPTMAAAWALFHPPPTAGVGWLLGFSLLLYTGWTMMMIPLYAWGAELSRDYDGRTRVMGVREGTILVGLLLALGLAAAFPEPDGRPSLRAMAWLVVIGLPVSVLILTLAAPRPPVAPQLPSLPRRAAWRALVENRPFLRLVLAYGINAIANGVPAIVFVLYCRHVLGDEGLSGPLLFLYFLCGVVGLPFWFWLSRRWSKHRAWCAAMIFACLVFSVVPLLGEGDAVAFAIIVALTGLCVGADLALTSAMQADVIDRDRLTTGRERAGLYFAIWGAVTKTALAASALVLPILGLLWGGADQPGDDSGKFALAVIYGWSPIVLKIVAIAVIWGFPITRATNREVQAQMAAQGSPP